MKPLRVLVADDNPVNQKLLVHILKGAGCSGVVVDDGAKVLKCLEQTAIDLVLLDDRMHVMHGLEALSILREREAASGRRTPVIMCTGNDLPSDRQRYLDAGADGYVAKPVEKELLLQEMARVCGRR